jgi:glycosyltransferase involved in cell wall biosynthesis
MRPHICFVAPSAWPVLAAAREIEFVGGAEVQQTILARNLVRRGYRVSMICGDYGQPERVTIDGITVVKSHSRISGVPIVRFFHPRLTGLWSALKAADADIYYQRTPGAATAVSGLFAKWYRRRFLYAAACDLDLAGDTERLFRRRGGLRDLQLYRLGLKLADVIVAQHERQAADCWQWHRRTAQVVPSCYEMPADGRANADGVVLWVSVLRAGKRPELFLELARRLPHLRFRIVGGQSTQAGDEAVFERIQEAAMSIPNLEFVGFVPFAEIDAHFNAARVFVNTSEYEGFPNTFLQSWSRGIPTVSFCETGSTSNRRPVVNVAADLHEMSQLVEKLMQDDNYWREAGDRARDRYKTFHTPDAALAAYEQLFARQGTAVETPRTSAAATIGPQPARERDMVKSRTATLRRRLL